MTTSDLPRGTIIGLYVGRSERRWPGRPPSAIGKRPVAGPLRVEAGGFVEDEQADLNAHGGPEQAIHHYAAENMDVWRAMFAGRAADFVPGCLGENVATEGLTEDNLCLGDVLTFGSARVQVCQGRQPCWKLAAHMELDALPPQFRRTGRTGWYYRVLEPGEVRVGDTMAVTGRPQPDWPLGDVIAAHFDPRLAPETARILAEMPVLSRSWRRSFARKAQRGAARFSESDDSAK